MSDGATTYLVHTGLGTAPTGELTLTRWLLDRQPTARVEVVHLREAGRGPQPLPPGFLEEIAGARRELLDAIATELGPDRVTTRLLEAKEIGAGLMEEAALLHAAAVVIPRKAGVTGRHIVRLGRDARHVLTHLSAPVVVVPADLASVGDGPVLLATDMKPGSTAAAGWARAWAENNDRPVVVVHVVPDVRDQGEGILSPVTARELQAAHTTEGEAALEEWAAREGFEDAERRLLVGRAETVLESLAEELSACTLVLGTNDRHGLERLAFGIHHEIAGAARCPVAIVPAHRA